MGEERIKNENEERQNQERQDEEQRGNWEEKGIVADFIDNIAGVLFSPVQTLRKIAFEGKIAQGIAVLILSELLPALAKSASSVGNGGMDFLSLSGTALEDIFPEFQNMPSLIAFGAILGALFAPFVHFVFTAVLELASQFASPGVKTLGPLKTGPALFAALAFATLPRVFMAPVSLLVRLTGVNVGPLFSLIFWGWAVTLQVIALRETHGFSTGRAVLVYFAPLFALAVLVAVIIALAISLFFPVTRNIW
ncbi:MAG: YIP1 family protein [Thermosediminibacteraceae bacterium]|nr:YIP1 family protein [Thermosediminibacteraceae bacterium]